jgi:hypothetical protein
LPNPFNDSVCFQFANGNVNHHILICNIQGTIIKEWDTLSDIETFNTSAWAAGMYFYKISEDKKVYAGKLIKE